MRLLHLLPPGILLIVTTPTSAFEIPYLTSLSLPITLQDYFPPSFSTNTTTQDPASDLRRRSNGCPNDFHACSNLGAPGLCCANAAVCTSDGGGNVACCPSNAVCTGTVTGSITAGTVNSIGGLASSTAAGGRGGGGGGGSGGQTTHTGGIVIQSNPASSTAASSRAVVVGGGGGGGNGGGDVGSSANRQMEVPLLARALLKALNYFVL